MPIWDFLKRKQQTQETNLTQQSAHQHQSLNDLINSEVNRQEQEKFEREENLRQFQSQQESQAIWAEERKRKEDIQYLNYFFAASLNVRVAVTQNPVQYDGMWFGMKRKKEMLFVPAHPEASDQSDIHYEGNRRPI